MIVISCLHNGNMREATVRYDLLAKWQVEAFGMEDLGVNKKSQI